MKESKAGEVTGRAWYSIVSVTQIVLLVLRCLCVIEWEWWKVLLPSIIGFGVVVVAVMLLIALVVVQKKTQSVQDAGKCEWGTITGNVSKQTGQSDWEDPYDIATILSKHNNQSEVRE